MGCAKFELSAFDQGFGNTAGAWVRLGNPDENAQYPDTINAAFESVFQFATAKAATTFQSQARSKFAACGSFTDPSSANFWRTLSVAKTTVSGHQAFLVTQQFMGPSYPFGAWWWEFNLYVVAGTNIYNIYEENGINDVPSTALMSKLIHQVQALYH